MIPLTLVATAAPATAGHQVTWSPWQWVNPLPQGNDLRALALTNPDTALALGETGTIIHTTNAGQHWSFPPRPFPENSRMNWGAFNDIDFTDPQTAIAVGVSPEALADVTGETPPLIIRTVDGGENWTSHEPPETVRTLDGVSFPSADTAYAVGATKGANFAGVIRSSDGGRTWQDVSPPTGITELNEVSFVNDNLGWAVGGDLTILRTTNGGGSWQVQASGEIGGIKGAGLHGVAFINQDVGVAIGDSGFIFRTTDGGQTWHVVLSGVDTRLDNVTFVTDQIGYAVGGLGAILRTDDAGETWHTQPSGTTLTLYDISFTSPDIGMAVGQYGLVLRTEDGGTTWNQLSEGFHHSLLGMSFPEPMTGTVVGSGGTILHTTNGGATWQPQDSGTTETLWDASFPDPSIGTVVGEGGIIRRTTDGGANWHHQPSGTTAILYGVSFPTPTVGTAVGDGGVVRRTENGGTTWNPQEIDIPNPENVILRDVHLTSADTGIAVGRLDIPEEFDIEGIIMRTTDGGDTWTSTHPQTPAKRFVSVYFVDPQTGWVVGDEETILRTVDGGQTWQEPDFIPPHLFGFTDIYFRDHLHGAAVTKRGGIIHSSDGGITWTAEPASTTRIATRGLNGIYFSDADTGIVIGGGGVILRRDGGAGEPGEPSGASQDIIATVPDQGGGSLVISVDPDDRTVQLPELQLAGTGDRLTTTGDLRPVTVADTRTTTNPGWDATAQVSDFTTDQASFGGGFLGWTPEVTATSEGQIVNPGGPVTPGFPTGDGLSIPRTLATAQASAGTGVAQLGAGLDLQIPIDTPPGTYTAVLTLTAI